MTENPQNPAGMPDERPETTPTGEADPTEDAPSPASEARPSLSGGSRSDIVYCVRCGATMGPGDLFCHSCGWDSRASLPRARVVVNPSDRNRLAALLLCLLLGPFGAHRFYAGKVGTGLLWLCTLGFLGIGVVYDLVLIAAGEFRDDQNRKIVHWN